MTDDRSLLEAAARAAGPLATVGAAATEEHAAWQERNAARLAYRKWLRNYFNETGEWFDPTHTEEDDLAEYKRLLAAKSGSQKRLTTARSATRRAIVRAAAAIGRAS